MSSNESGQQNSKKRKRITQVKPESRIEQLSQWCGRDTSSSTATAQSAPIISMPNMHPNSPPMTFDQQTQTDFKPNANEYVESRPAKILQNTEMNMQPQQTSAQQYSEIKQQVHNLGAQLYEVKSMLSDVLSRMQNVVNGQESENPNNNDVYSPNSVLYSARNSTPTALGQASNILNWSQQPMVPHQSHQSQQTYSSLIAIEPIEANNDGNFSISNPSIHHTDIDQSPSSLNSSEQAIDLKGDSNDSSRSFVDDDGNADDEVIIGNNQTTVSRSVLMRINWKSHPAATRKLLRAKFSRDILATHTLTGKPSPGK